MIKQKMLRLRQSSMRFSNKQRTLLYVAVSAVAIGVWQYFVYNAGKDPVPAGMCATVGYGSCAASSQVWGDIVWGSMGLLMIVAPACIAVATALIMFRVLLLRRRER